MSVNGLIRFYRRGALDADRRIAAILAPPPIVGADRYLMSSFVVRSFDRVTRMLRSALLNSELAHAASVAQDAWSRLEWPGRYRAIARMLIVAVAFHLAATILQGERPGWFWLIVPALTFVFAVLLLIASRPTRSSR
jgi:hypothetical protein